MFARIGRSWNEMSTVRKLWRVFMLALLAVGIWALTPLFYSRQVNEEFPVTQSQPAPAMQSEAMAKPTAQAIQSQGDEAMTKATVAPVMVAPAAQAPAPTTGAIEPVVLSSGSFTRVDVVHGAEGSATIYKLPDGTLVLRLENFKSTNGPDLFVGLSGHPMPRSKGEVHDQGYVELARLKGNEGNQNYEVPTDLDLSKFKSIVIYCRTFNVVFSTAELKAY
jgi:hypothetical protein